MESFRRDHFNDVAEHRSILKNNQNTYYPRFSFTPKTVIASPKTGVLFLLWMQSLNFGVYLPLPQTLLLWFHAKRRGSHCRRCRFCVAATFYGDQVLSHAQTSLGNAVAAKQGCECRFIALCYKYCSCLVWDTSQTLYAEGKLSLEKCDTITKQEMQKQRFFLVSPWGWTMCANMGRTWRTVPTQI